MTGSKVFAALLACFALSVTAQVAPPPPQNSDQSRVPARAQLPTLTPRSHEEREARYHAQHNIILNVLVTDASGKPVTELGQQDFTILDNGHPQPISAFRLVHGNAAAAATHVLLMLDTANNTPRGIAAERKELERFLLHDQGRLAYPTSIGIFSGSGANVSRPSRDGRVLADDLANLIGNAHGFNCAEEGAGREVEYATSIYGTAALPVSGEGSPQARVANCLNQRFRLSVSALNRLAREQVEIPGREILVWIGPGWPRLSDRGFSPDTVQLRQNFFAYLVELSTALREAQVTLDAVSVPDLFRRAEIRSDQDNLYFDGIPDESRATAGSLSLQALAHQSGGRVQEEGREIGSEIAACIADVESYYVLSFDSAPASEANEFHSLRVTVSKPGLTVRTNTVYYAQP